MPNAACLTRVAASQVADLIAPVRRGHHIAQPNFQRAGILQLAGKLEVTNWQYSFECGLSCSVLVSTYPMAAVGTGVKRGDGRRTWGSDRPPRPSPAFPQLALHHPPRTCVVAAAPPGGRRRASRRSNSVRTLRGWLEPARGEFPAPNSPLGPPPVPHAGFLGHWEAQKSVECIRCDFLRSGCD
jgi:hypothetical protein